MGQDNAGKSGLGRSFVYLLPRSTVGFPVPLLRY
jgi:hypothetical protein